MLPHFIAFNLGHLFINEYPESFYNLAGKGVKKVKENVEFYKVLYPIIWNKKSSKTNAAFIFCLFLVCLQTILSKLSMLIDKEITNSFSSVLESSKLVIPWGFLILKSMMEMINRSIVVGKGKLYNRMEKGLSNRLQTEAFFKIHEMSTRWNIETGIGEINGLVQNGSRVLWLIIQNCFFALLPNVASASFSFYYVSTRYSFWLGIIILAFSTVNLAAANFFRKWSKQMREKKKDAEEEIFDRSMESLSNFQTVKYFTREDNEKSRFKKLKEAQTNSDNDLEDWSDLFNLFLQSLTIIVSLGITLYGANQLSNGIISYGEYILLSRLFIDLYYDIHALYSDVMFGVIQHFETIDKTVMLLNETPEITDKYNSEDIKLNNGRIEFKNVSFSYDTMKDSANRDVTKNDSQKDFDIADVSFVVESGQCLALVGTTGSGKSTIAKLLTRMYDVAKGEILIDNQDISEVTLKSLRSSIGIVPQEVELFNDKIVNNVKYGRADATDEEVHDAALKAEIHEKIMKMDDKYETKVGNKGLKLSGGERQRLGIARVFLKNPKIVILDEATSALDTLTEKKIQSSLEKTYKGRTSVIIAHRLSTVCHADQIIVMDGGKVVEKGSHEELIKLGGLYETMWSRQAKNAIKRTRKSY